MGRRIRFIFNDAEEDNLLSVINEITNDEDVSNRILRSSTAYDDHKKIHAFLKAVNYTSKDSLWDNAEYFKSLNFKDFEAFIKGNVVEEIGDLEVEFE